LTTTSRPNANFAYLYGRFSIRSESSVLTNGYPTMGFKLVCADGHAYTIRFLNQPKIEVIEVTPSACQISEIVYSDASDGITGRRRAPPGWMSPRTFEAGRAYYLGDYEAEYAHEWKIIETEHTWKLTSEENDYDSSTKDFAATFTGFAAMPTADKSFVSAPPRARPRRRPAGIPSPSPQQLARAALLIRRTFPTMKACEADCATGDCLAFRGPAGTAMTCVVYCRGKKDCPDGYSCSGPSGDVQPARGADDTEQPLTGICVAAPTTASE